MRSTTILVTTLLAVLALSVGTFAYPAVVGSHLSTNGGGATAAPKVSHPPAGDDNGTANDTESNDTAPVPPVVNETENETANASAEANVTVEHDNTTIWINGTIDVVADNLTVVNLSFEIRVTEGQGANVTFNGTVLENGTEVTVGGTVQVTPEERLADVHASYALSRGGTVLVSRDLAFQLAWPEGVEARLVAMPLPGLSFGLDLTHV